MASASVERFCQGGRPAHFSLNPRQRRVEV
jgi:hypothetical protein